MKETCCRDNRSSKTEGQKELPKIILCCSFTELSFDYDYAGLSSFNDYADHCIFFNSGLSRESVSKINSQMIIPISWTKYLFVDFCTMRNDLLRKARRYENSIVIMADDCYCMNSSLSKEEIKRLNVDLIECDFKCHDYKSVCPKIFRSHAFEYILQVHEIITPIRHVTRIYTDHITILDVPDYERSHERVLQDIHWMKSDLQVYGRDPFIKAHICIYLGDAYYIINRKEEAVAEYQRVIKLGESTGCALGTGGSVTNPSVQNYVQRALSALDLLFLEL